MDKCAKCGQDPLLVVDLNCGDIYCFLCLKSIWIFNVMNSNIIKCLKCNMDSKVDIEHISRDFRTVLSGLAGKYVWLYISKSNDGWWMFDPKTSKNIETTYVQGIPQCSYNIGDTNYIVKFGADEGEQMLNLNSTNLNSFNLNSFNLNSNNPIVKYRKVKRVIFDKTSIKTMNIKGISGIFFEKIENEIGKFLY